MMILVFCLLCIGFSSEVADLPTHEDLRIALTKAVLESNGGFGLNMWATVVNRDGVVDNVCFTGADRGDQWPGSRVISAQKANTANAFSLPSLALSTANLYSAVQPGGSLYGLQHSNPVDTSVAYGGCASRFGTPDDPMKFKRIGGVNVFGGGLPLYNSEGELVGAIGVSGDSSCADHNIAWKVRHYLALDYVPAGVGYFDNIIYDGGGWSHPICSDEAVIIANGFTVSHPVRVRVEEGEL